MKTKAQYLFHLALMVPGLSAAEEYPFLSGVRVSSNVVEGDPVLVSAFPALCGPNEQSLSQITIAHRPGVIEARLPIGGTRVCPRGIHSKPLRFSLGTPVAGLYEVKIRGVDPISGELHDLPPESHGNMMVRVEAASSSLGVRHAGVWASTDRPGEGAAISVGERGVLMVLFDQAAGSAWAVSEWMSGGARAARIHSPGTSQTPSSVAGELRYSFDPDRTCEGLSLTVSRTNGDVRVMHLRKAEVYWDPEDCI